MIASIVKWRLILYIFRFLFLMLNAILFAYWYYYMVTNWLYPVSDLPTESSQLATLATIICGCVNDFYMLTWDIYTYGSFASRAIPQSLISLVLTAVLTLEIVLLYKRWHLETNSQGAFSGMPELLSAIPPLIISPVILAILWIRSPSRLWDVGNRDTGITIFLFGRRRSANDDARKFASKIRKVGRDIVYRRIEHLESIQYAMTRNIAAVILLALLVAQSVVLIHGVIFENFDAREVWRDRIGSAPDWCDFQVIPDIDANQTWSLFTTVSGSAANVTTSDILSAQESCVVGSSSPNQIECSFNNACDSDHMNTADIVVTPNISDYNSSAFRRIWLGPVFFDTSFTRLYDHGIHIMWGYQLLGLVELTERRTIQRGFTDMWGFKPYYSGHYVPSIDWMQRTPLDNASVARVTLQWKTPEGMNEDMIRVTEDYRQHTFLSALSSIGGLLSVLQGLHILCFGKPLFWGMFGSKLLNPFGLFIWGSRALRERMAARYGFDSKSGAFSAEGLSLFLRDFLLDIGPLEKDKKDEDDNGDDVEIESEERPLTTGETHVYDIIPLGPVAGER